MALALCSGSFSTENYVSLVEAVHGPQAQGNGMRGFESMPLVFTPAGPGRLRA